MQSNWKRGAKQSYFSILTRTINRNNGYVFDTFFHLRFHKRKEKRKKIKRSYYISSIAIHEGIKKSQRKAQQKQKRGFSRFFINSLKMSAAVDKILNSSVLLLSFIAFAFFVVQFRMVWQNLIVWCFVFTKINFELNNVEFHFHICRIQCQFTQTWTAIELNSNHVEFDVSSKVPITLSSVFCIEAAKYMISS